MEQWKQDAPVVELDQFPIVAEHIGLADDGPHTIRNNAITNAVKTALGLPKAIGLSADVRYADLYYASGGGPRATHYRIRINGFAFGEGSKKANEYLSISILGLHDGDIVAWSEDVQRLGGTPKGWADFHAGKFPGRTSPPPLKGSPKSVGRLTFVDPDDNPIDITQSIRALVANAANPVKATSSKRTGAVANTVAPKVARKSAKLR